MSKDLEPKLDNFEAEVKGVVKTRVVDETNKLEDCIDKKFEEAKREANELTESVARNEQLLSTNASSPAGGGTAVPTASIPFPPYASAAASQVHAPFSGPSAYRPSLGKFATRRC